MNKLLGLLLISTLAMGNIQQEPLEDVVDCLATYLPKLLKDLEQVYSDFQSQNVSGLFTDIQALVADSQEAIECAKTQSLKALKQKATKQAVQDIAQCVTEYTTDLKYHVEKLQNDFQLAYYISIIGDVQDILNDTQTLVDCLGVKTSIADLGKLMKFINETDVLSCLSQFIPSIITDVSNIITAAKTGDVAAIIASISPLVGDGLKLTTCLVG